MLRELAAQKEQIAAQYKQDKEQYLTMAKDLKDSFQLLRNTIEQDRTQLQEALTQMHTDSDNHTHSTSVNHSELNRHLDNLHKETAERQQKIEKNMAALKKEWNNFKVSIEQQVV